MKNKKLFVFDLDGTLTESKASLEREMARLLGQLTTSYRRVAVISGCSFGQLEKQFIKPLNEFYPYRRTGFEGWSNLYLLPTSGSSMYQWENGFHRVYGDDLTLREKANIYNAWNSSTIRSDLTNTSYGEIAEDRGSQVTFSMCGQDAPLDIKEKYDPDAAIRGRIILAMHKYLVPDAFELKTGGTTSIDVTRKGIDKAYGMSQLLNRLNIDKEDTAFIGDALYPGGNDSAVKKTGVECIETSGPENTIEIIKSILGDC